MVDDGLNVLLANALPGAILQVPVYNEIQTYGLTAVTALRSETPCQSNFEGIWYGLSLMLTRLTTGGRNEYVTSPGELWPYGGIAFG